MQLILARGLPSFPGFSVRSHRFAYAPVVTRLVRMLYEVMHGIVPPLMRAVWRPKVIGLEHVPDTGGVIIASNHLSFVDSIAIPSVVKRKVVFLTKSDYFTGSGPKGFVSRAFFEGLGMLPVDRDDNKAAIASLGPRSRCSVGVRRSGSTPRAPGRATAGSTAAAPASATSR